MQRAKRISRLEHLGPLVCIQYYCNCQKKKIALYKNYTLVHTCSERVLEKDEPFLCLILEKITQNALKILKLGFLHDSAPPNLSALLYSCTERY